MPRQKRLHNATGSYHVMLRGDTTLLTGGTSHPFRFTGKELDRLNSLNMYDFGARWYDVAGVPMWTSIDPLAEKWITGSVLMIIFQDRQSINGNVNETSNELQ